MIQFDDTEEYDPICEEVYNYYIYGNINAFSEYLTAKLPELLKDLKDSYVVIFSNCFYNIGILFNNFKNENQKHLDFWAEAESKLSLSEPPKDFFTYFARMIDVLPSKIKIYCLNQDKLFAKCTIIYSSQLELHKNIISKLELSRNFKEYCDEQIMLILFERFYKFAMDSAQSSKQLLENIISKFEETKAHFKRLMLPEF